MAGAPLGNKNSEKWTIEIATDLFDRCIEVAKDRENEYNDFIGEVAMECDSYLTQLDYLITKFPELDRKYRRIKSYCEANCFRSAKKNKIVPSLAIMNLKSNHGWTDRVDNTSKGQSTNQPVNITFGKGKK